MSEVSCFHMIALFFKRILRRPYASERFLKLIAIHYLNFSLKTLLMDKMQMES